MKPTEPLNSRGQTLIETALALMLVVSVLTTSLLVVYAHLVVHWCDFWSYRALICMIDEKSPSLCQEKLENKMSLVLAKNSFKVQELWIKKEKTQIRIQISIPPWIQKIEHKEILLPLRREALP